jgi:hypothetical protein
MSKLHISTAKKKKKKLNKECRERRKICKHTLPQCRLIGVDDEESAKVMKLFLDDSRLSFWRECLFSSFASAFLCKLR